MHKAAGTIMSYVITGTNQQECCLSNGLGRGGHQEGVELMGDGTRDVHITIQTAAFIVMRNFPTLYGREDVVPQRCGGRIER